MNSFNLYIGLAFLFEHLLNWISCEDSLHPGTYIPQLVPEYQHTWLISGQQLADDVLSAIKTWEKTSELPKSALVSIRRDLFQYSHLDDVAKPFNCLSIDWGEGQSFHLCLHRFYGHVLHCLTMYPHHSTTLLNHWRDQFCSLDETSNTANATPSASPVHRNDSNLLFAKGLDTTFCSYPLRVIALSAQIKLGLWRRNGSEMLHQLMNYQNPPFNKFFRSIDVFLLQCVHLTCEGEICRHRFRIFVS
jgi:hypothetical protein